MPRPVIVFDVIETLLDLGALRPGFDRLFGPTRTLEEWFLQVIQTAMVSTIVEDYCDFAAVGRHAFDVVCASRGVEVTETDRTALLSGVRALPPHPEVAGALASLKKAGFRLATLTNSAQSAADAQLANAGLHDFFERAISVEAIRRFKPSAEVYRHAAAELGVGIGDLRLVAAHDWDVTGALRAGARAAFVARPGKALGPLSAKPDIIGADMTAVVEQIMRVDR